MLDVVALGELLIDFAPQSVNEAGYPVLSANPGGAPANVAVVVSRLGGESGFIGCVGDDLYGRMLRETALFFRQIRCPFGRWIRIIRLRIRP